MKSHRQAAGIGALLGALGLPTLVMLLELRRVGDPVALIGLLTLSAALNSIWPLGGGMLAEGTYRSRFLRFEWTHDIDRSLGEAFTAGLVMGAVTAGSFFIYLPLLAEVWLRVPLGISPTVLTWVALATLLAVTALRHRSEHRLYEWRARVESGVTPSAAEIQSWTAALRSLARPNGSIGHLGGIGAITVGLHEHLDAERVLRSLVQQPGATGVAELHARSLDYLASCALQAGGFAAYPGGDARLEHTARAVEALGGRVSAEQLAAHRAFAETCRRGDAFARSARGDADPDELEWGRRLLSGG